MAKSVGMKNQQCKRSGGNDINGIGVTMA